MMVDGLLKTKARIITYKQLLGSPLDNPPKVHFSSKLLRGHKLRFQKLLPTGRRSIESFPTHSLPEERLLTVAVDQWDY